MATKTYEHAGQPTKYKPEYCQALMDFFDQEPWEDVKFPIYDAEGNKTKDITKRLPRKLPSLVDFAKSINVGISTAYDWVNPDHDSYQKQFSDTYKNSAKRLQKWVLTHGAMTGYYNPGFAKFVAVNISEMRDKTDHNVTGDLTIGVVKFSKEDCKKTNAE